MAPPPQELNLHHTLPKMFLGHISKCSLDTFHVIGSSVFQSFSLSVFQLFSPSALQPFSTIDFPNWFCSILFRFSSLCFVLFVSHYFIIQIIKCDSVVSGIGFGVSVLQSFSLSVFQSFTLSVFQSFSLSVFQFSVNYNISIWYI